MQVRQRLVSTVLHRYASFTSIRCKSRMANGSKNHHNELHIVYDFFTDNPQNVLPVNDGERLENPFYDPYWGSIRSMQQNEQFLEGMLLKSIDVNPRFPYLHYVVYNNNNPSRSSRASSQDRQGGSPALQTEVELVDILNSQGGYSEMYTFVDRATPLLPKRPSNPNTAYIVSAFRTCGHLDDLDQKWSYWSGADFIANNIPPHLRLQRLTFNKIKNSTEKPENFTYVLMCELGEALADANKAREFLDTLKFRQCGFSSLYTIDHFF